MEQDSWHTVTIEEAASVLSENNLCYNFLPGEDFQYSDTGFTLLAGIIERVSGKSYGEYVMEKLLRPNGMTYSYLPFRGDDQTMPEPVLPGFVYYDGQNTPVESDNISFQLGNGNILGKGFFDLRLECFFPFLIHFFELRITDKIYYFKF